MALNADRAAAPGQARGGWAAAAVLCVGVWLHAGDSLLAATVMPSAIQDIGGLDYIYWTVALYQLGSIAAGAATGLLTIRLGLRAGMAIAALIYGIGCVVSAAAPDMAVMLAGRALQGLGGGWMMALSHVGVTQLFPAHAWPRLLAIISGVWGVSALLGPLIGGAFATAGFWRGAFWAFAAQALIVAVLVPLILKPAPGEGRTAQAVPWRRLWVLSGGVLLVLAAGVQRDVVAAALCLMPGAALLWLVLWLESRAPVRLFPRRPLSLRAPWGAGYLMVLLLCAATISFGTYGAYFMEVLYGTTPLVAGLVLAVESVAWTVTAVMFAGAGPRVEPWLIRGGALAIAGGLVGLAAAMPQGPVPALVPWAFLTGGGFGACWSFLIRRIVESVPLSEREQATSSVPTMQMLGYALGAAASGIVANMAGLTEGAPRATVETAAFWVFAAFIPAAAAGVWAAWRAGSLKLQ